MKVLAALQLDIAAVMDNKQLKQQLRQYLPELPRRVDRLTWQCLLAGAPFKPQLHSSCGLYLASQYPSRDTMASLLNSVCVAQLQPKPFEFVNSVSNAASFYLARLLGLDGPNLCLGSHAGIWPQLLQLAQCDLVAGHVQQALLINCREESAGDCQLQVVLVQAEGTAETGRWWLSADFAQLTEKAEVVLRHAWPE